VELVHQVEYAARSSALEPLMAELEGAEPPPEEGHEVRGDGEAICWCWNVAGQRDPGMQALLQLRLTGDPSPPHVCMEQQVHTLLASVGHDIHCTIPNTPCGLQTHTLPPADHPLPRPLPAQGPSSSEDEAHGSRKSSQTLEDQEQHAGALTGRPEPRRRLPAPRPLGRGFSIWSMLKNAIGGDLTRITMPATINEPISFLQRLGEIMEYRWAAGAAAVSAAGVADRLVLWSASRHGKRLSQSGVIMEYQGRGCLDGQCACAVRHDCTEPVSTAQRSACSHAPAPARWRALLQPLPVPIMTSWKAGSTSSHQWQCQGPDVLSPTACLQGASGECGVGPHQHRAPAAPCSLRRVALRVAVCPREQALQPSAGRDL
jgi:hypothetical protein